MTGEKDIKREEEKIEQEGQEEAQAQQEQEENLKQEEREENETENWKEQYLRLAAEYENYRKRVIREYERIRKEAEEKVWLEIFPLIDDIYRAISASSESDNIESIREGLKIIKEKIEKLFSKNEIEPIPDKGHEFDSNLHEAIAWIETPDEEQKGKIIDVVEKGYKKGDKVIKHSKVVVGK